MTVKPWTHISNRVPLCLGYPVHRFLSPTRRHREEALAGSEAALWLQEKSLTLEHAGELLSRYEVEHEPSNGKLRGVGLPTLFGTSFLLGQPRLFDLAQALGEEGWLKALKLGEYAPRKPRRPEAPQQVLFAYAEAP